MVVGGGNKNFLALSWHMNALMVGCIHACVCVCVCVFVCTAKATMTTVFIQLFSCVCFHYNILYML